MPNQQLGFGKRFAAAVKSAVMSWGGANVNGSSLQSEISATLIGGVPVGNIRLSTDSLYTIWRNHGDIYGAVRELAQAVGVAGYYWENAADSEKDANAASVKAAEAILTKNQTFRQWIKELVTDVSVAGNAYYYIEKSKGNGKPISLSRIDPRMVTAVTDKYGVLKRWVQRGGADSQVFLPEEVVHFITLKDPNSPVFGIAPLEPILWDIRTDLAAMISNYALFANDSTPASMFIFEEQMTDEEIGRQVKKIQEQLKGAENRHKSIGMKGLKEIKTVSITNKDMEFSTLRKITTEKVCATYGVPKSILGYTEDVNLANGEEQTKKFWEGTVEPLEEAIAEFINRKLLPALGITDVRLCFEVRDFDNREWDESSTRADLQLGILTLNEVREMRGKQPYDQGKHGELVDAPIVYGGIGARPLEDIGVDMDEGFPAVVDEESAEKAMHRLGHFARVASYGKPKQKQGAKS